MKERLLGQRDSGDGLRVELAHLRKFNADLLAELQNLQLDRIDAGRQLLQAFHFGRTTVASSDAGDNGDD